MKAAGLGSRRSSVLSEDTALELPLLLTRVPLVFLCRRHCGSRDETRRFDSDRVESSRAVDEELGAVKRYEPTPGGRTTRVERRCKQLVRGEDDELEGEARGQRTD